MTKRPLHLLALAAALYATGAMVVFLTTEPNIAPVARAADMPAPTLLPTVVVRPEPEIPVLAQVTVRPEDTVFDAGAPPRLRSVARAHASTVGTGGFDMPYYSFGKSLRHSSKE